MSDQQESSETKVTTWQDIQDAGPESPEHAYRRGYHDGWILAIDAMHDLMFRDGLGRQKAYDAAWDHWHKALADWLDRAGDNAEIEYAPELGRQKRNER